MKGNQTVSNDQIKNLLITTLIGVGVLSLPSQMANILENDGWIPIIIAGLFFVPFLIMVDRLYKLYPNRSIFEIVIEVYGKVIFNILMIIVVIYFIMITAYTTRVFGEVIKTYLLETTPMEVIVLTMLLATAYLSRSQLQVLARTATMIYPILILLVIFLTLISIPDSDYTNMLPVFNSDFKKLPSAIVASLFSYAGYEIIFLVYPYSDDKKNTLKYVLRALFIVIGIYIIVFVITLSLFGVDQLKRGIWPTIALASEADLPGYFLENLDGIVLSLWVMVVYSTLGPVLFQASRILSSILNTKSHDFLVILLIPIIYIICVLPENIVLVYERLGKVLNYFTVASSIVIPIIIFIGAWVKKRRSKA